MMLVPEMGVEIKEKTFRVFSLTFEWGIVSLKAFPQPRGIEIRMEIVGFRNRLSSAETREWYLF